MKFIDGTGFDTGVEIGSSVDLCVLALGS
jgi:hypothetical protein